LKKFTGYGRFRAKAATHDLWGGLIVALLTTIGIIVLAIEAFF
jgi:hypothetical protein